MVELPPFQDPNLGQQYTRYLDWADAQGWTSGALRRRGSRLERTWTLGEPGDDEIPAAGTTKASLSVFAGSNPSSSHGLQWSAGVRDADGRGLFVRVVTGGGSVTPDQVSIELQQGGAPTVALGAPLLWKVGERVVQTPRPEGLDGVTAALDAHRTVGEAGMRDLEALDALVRPVLDSGKYTVCDYEPSPGNGIPGRCVPRAPTDAERSLHRAAFDAELGRRRAALGDPAWAALFAAVAPR